MYPHTRMLACLQERLPKLIATSLGPQRQKRAESISNDDSGSCLGLLTPYFDLQVARTDRAPVSASSAYSCCHTYVYAYHDYYSILEIIAIVVTMTIVVIVLQQQGYESLHMQTPPPGRCLKEPTPPAPCSLECGVLAGSRFPLPA